MCTITHAKGTEYFLQPPRPCGGPTRYNQTNKCPSAAAQSAVFTWMTWAAAWLTYRTRSRMSRGGNKMSSKGICCSNYKSLFLSLSACLLSARVCSCAGVRLCTDLYVPHRQAAGVRLDRNIKRFLCHSHTSHATWTLPHCLLGAGRPGPTLAPALSLRHQM